MSVPPATLDTPAKGTKKQASSKESEVIEPTESKQDEPSVKSVEAELLLRDGQKILLPPRKKVGGGLNIGRYFSNNELHPYLAIQWRKTNLEIKDFETGKVRFKRDNVECPAHWDQNAVLITSDKYLYGSKPGTAEYEESLRQPFDRIANTYTVWAWSEGYLATLKDAEIFNDELKAMLVKQIWAPNSPVWFNIGHYEQWRWGRADLREKAQRGAKAYFSVERPVGGKVEISAAETNTMAHPQCSACFLLEVKDNMESILEHLKTEGRVFASGSGIGVNVSTLRSSVEPITGKGHSSGPVSFDKGWDRMAGAIKSGGKTRRAARMVLLFGDHPDIFRFIRVKNDQEEFAKIVLREHNVTVGLRKLAAQNRDHSAASKLVDKMLAAVPVTNQIEYSKHMDGLLYGETLAHQNANHSVSLKGDFWRAFYADENYHTRWVSKPDHIHETFPARKLLREMAENVWGNGEPGQHNNDWINLWNPVKEHGDITTSNPCSEYLHLNNTSCNLASFNVFRFIDMDTHTFDAKGLAHASRLAMICADLNIQCGGFPIPEIAVGTRHYRTTGLGFANTGGLLMAMGIPYDSDEGRWICSQLTSLLTSTSFKVSAELGAELGGYIAFDETQGSLRQVLNLHRVVQELSTDLPGKEDDFLNAKIHDLYNRSQALLPTVQGLNGLDALNAFRRVFVDPSKINQSLIAGFSTVRDMAHQTWREVCVPGQVFRNSFTTVMAPTGTISAPLGCYDEGTTSIEPDYTLVKFKQLSGGGHIKMFNRLALEGLHQLGYSEFQVREAAFECAGLDGLLTACTNDETEALAHLSTTKVGHAGPVRIALQSLLLKSDSGLNDDPMSETHSVDYVKKVAWKLRQNPYDPDITDEQKLVLNGKSHLEDVPWLAPEHLATFDCSATNGDGQRYISVEGHLRMLGAVQPFISGASSKTCNLPNSATVDDIERSFIICHNMGIKCIALFRAESKANSVYQVDTPEGRRHDPQTVYKQLLISAESILDIERQKFAGPIRRKLPGRRMGQTIKFSLAGAHKGYISVGVYPDGRCGEIFGRIGQQGTYANGVLDAFCKAISIQLQYGIALDDVLHDFRYMTFEPSGFVVVEDDSEDGRAAINSCSSVIDLIMKIMDYLFPGPDRCLRPLNNQLELPSVAMPPRTLKEQIDVNESLALGVETIVNKTKLPGAGGSGGRMNFRTAGSANICPKCSQLTFISDGKCKRCVNPGCLYKDGGCGE
ncbi:MAG: ribonucleoside-diphosphate reductase, adenosylcobalamin-dependent [Verrucomicrobiota bacterium]|nr:ribonucleoside-diphosphate reductase, adenosylcobalamin-dependent [Verrucomicrobiota bacterium]